MASNPSDRCLLLMSASAACRSAITRFLWPSSPLWTYAECCPLGWRSVANLLMMTCMFPVGNIPVIIPDYSMPTHSCEPTVCARYCPQFRCRRVLRSGAGYRDARKSCRAIPHTSSGGLAQPTRILSLYKCSILYRA